MFGGVLNLPLEKISTSSQQYLVFHRSWYFLSSAFFMFSVSCFVYMRTNNLITCICFLLNSFGLKIFNISVKQGAGLKFLGTANMEEMGNIENVEYLSGEDFVMQTSVTNRGGNKIRSIFANVIIECSFSTYYRQTGQLENIVFQPFIVSFEDFKNLRVFNSKRK